MVRRPMCALMFAVDVSNRDSAAPDARNAERAAEEQAAGGNPPPGVRNAEQNGGAGGSPPPGAAAELLAFIRDYRARSGFSPTYREMANGIGRSRSKICALLRELELSGAIRRRRYRARSVTVIAP